MKYSTEDLQLALAVREAALKRLHADRTAANLGKDQDAEEKWDIANPFSKVVKDIYLEMEWVAGIIDRVRHDGHEPLKLPALPLTDV